MTHNELKKIIRQGCTKIQIQYQKKCKHSLEWTSISKTVFKLRWVWQAHQNVAVCCSFSSWVVPSKLAGEPKTAMEVLEVRI